MEQLKKDVEKQIDNIKKTGITKDNLDSLYKLVDIHKDIENEEYWKKKGESYENVRE